ncbi:MAG: hypothetical protein L6290_11245 [Thermodesulfovibrionales bacterium]|nr:hypothetical protein [Thermodesulfovibrionales bacterium]
MNILKAEKQEMAIAALVEGSSVRSVERMTGIHRDTIIRLMMVRVSQNCEEIHDSTMCNSSCKTLQVDEIWCYVGKKQRHLTETDNREELGDQWVFVALDTNNKLIPSYIIGKRSAENAQIFIKAERLDNRIQLSSDALTAYIEAVELAFGSNVDYGQIVKSYEAEPLGAGQYSPPQVIGAEKIIVSGIPIKI